MILTETYKDRVLAMRCITRYKQHIYVKSEPLFFAFLTALSLMTSNPGCLQAQTITINSDKQIQYADSLFSQGEYLRAIDEYKRFVYVFPKDSRIHLARYRIGMAYYEIRRYEPAIREFSTLISQNPERELLIQSHWRLSECHAKIGRYAAAILDLENLMAIEKGVNIRDEAFYRMGWIYMETASFKEALESFRKIHPDNASKYQLSRIFAELTEPLNIPKKNPKIAGFLSILPGAGYLYTERYRDALFAFLINAAFFLAAYESFDSDLNALGAITGVVGLGFYAGNIYGAISSAHKHNRRQTRKFIENLKRNIKIQLSSDS
ncbi:MAG: tetratricopeptide repeat protein, partial [Deltaproteobacteria bacterium]|nr:tetratricopeptide repeat protein [Deltaproteobacteria bacterium]